MSQHGRPLAEGKPSSIGKVGGRLLPYLAPHKGRLALIGVMLILGTLVDLVGPYLIGVAVDQFIDPSGGAMPAWLAMLLGPSPDRRTGLGATMLLVLGAYLIIWALNVVEFRLMVRVAQKVLLAMRTQILTQIQRLGLDFFDQHEAGDLMSRLVNDTQVINDMFGAGLTRLLRMSLVMVGILVAMFALNWRLALASFAVLPLVAVATVVFSTRARHAFRRTRQTIGAVSAELQENISGVREVQAFHRERASMSEFRAVNERNRSANVEAQTLTSLFHPVMEILSTSATAIVVGYGGYLVLGFTPSLVSVGVIVSFLTYVRRFYQPIQEMANLYTQFVAALAGAERIFELLDTPPTIVDAPDAVDLPPIEGRIVYDRVRFHYVEGEPVLDDVSLTIEPGKTVALVGPTGAGKTTMVNLVPRFYDVKVGAVRVDGYDVRSVTMQSLREQVGVVPQDAFLFSGTVMDNIRYGRLDATDEEVVDAARVANAHSFIERLPKGYDTEVGERGHTLSQGNRQLLAIARAILKDPRILILDEATSSVDTRTELLIQRGLSTLLAGRTSLVIAHRLSTIRNADEIVVIVGGRIVERGTHTTLMEAGGVYHDLYMSQFRRQEAPEAAPTMPLSALDTPAPAGDGE